MSLLSELITIITNLGIPAQTAIYKDKAPDTYTVLTPLIDHYGFYSDNMPVTDVEEVRISLFTKENYRALKRNLERALLTADITITDRRYIGHEDNTGYHHYAIDVANHYIF